MEPASSIGAKDWTHVKRLTVDEGEGLRRSWGLDRRCVRPAGTFISVASSACCGIARAIAWQQQLVEFGLVVTGASAGPERWGRFESTVSPLGGTAIGQ